MAEMADQSPVKLADRWPTVLGIVGGVGAGAATAWASDAMGLFSPVVVMMAGIYLAAYAMGRRSAVWIALAAFSLIVAVLLTLSQMGALPVNPVAAMSGVVVVAWLWTVARGRFADRGLFFLQTIGMLVFGAFAIAGTVVVPAWGSLLIGVGFLGHAGWDTYHFRRNKVVSRSYAEFCGVFDLVLGSVLIVASLL